MLDHPELGQTLSRADGRYDLVLNGGGLLTLTFERDDLLPVHRQVDAPWQDYVAVPDAVMVALDPAVTTVDFATSTTMQVHRATVASDADGSRQATVLVPSGTTATLVAPNGTETAVGELHLRATEYTVGPSGPAAMPAPLPPNSGYTYAVELSADEAIASGAARVALSQPVVFYVEGFLGFPAGMAVPVGFYDRQRGAWVPADNGRVVKVVAVTGGQADLDVTGDDVADEGATLAALGVTTAERGTLAQLYAAGQTLWRVAIPHFTA